MLTLLQPCTVRDFMNYVKYVEHSAENLQFFLWYRDYCARFEQLPQSERALSPIWTAEKAEAEAAVNAGHNRSKHVEPGIAAVLKGTDFAEGGQGGVVTERADPFDTPPKSSVDEKRDPMSDYGSSMGDEKTVASSAHRTIASQAFDDAGMKWKPCKCLLRRAHLDAVLLTSHSHHAALS